jgi:hypothetical protein
LVLQAGSAAIAEPANASNAVITKNFRMFRSPSRYARPE